MEIRICVGLLPFVSAMDDCGGIELMGEGEEVVQCLNLCWLVAILIKVIKSNFTNGDKLLILRELCKW